MLIISNFNETIQFSKAFLKRSPDQFLYDV